MGWAVPDLAKYLIITVSSFLGGMVLYEYLVRRIAVLRILFGMKPLPRAASPDGRLPVSRLRSGG